MSMNGLSIASVQPMPFLPGWVDQVLMLSVVCQKRDILSWSANIIMQTTLSGSTNTSGTSFPLLRQATGRAQRHEMMAGMVHELDKSVPVSDVPQLPCRLGIASP